MNVRLRNLAVMVGVLTLAGSARAGINVILIEPANAVSFRLQVGADEKEPTLYLPKHLLAKAKPTGENDKKGHAALWPTTLIVGVGLALTLTVSGLGFLRSRNRPGVTALSVVLALAGILIAGRYALRAEPPAAHSEPPHLTFSGGIVRVEVEEEGDAVRLVVPKAQLTDWAARLKAPENKE